MLKDLQTLKCSSLCIDFKELLLHFPTAKGVTMGFCFSSSCVGF